MLATKSPIDHPTPPPLHLRIQHNPCPSAPSCSRKTTSPTSPSPPPNANLLGLDPSSTPPPAPGTEFITPLAIANRPQLVGRPTAAQFATPGAFRSSSGTFSSSPLSGRMSPTLGLGATLGSQTPSFTPVEKPQSEGERFAVFPNSESALPKERLVSAMTRMEADGTALGLLLLLCLETPVWEMVMVFRGEIQVDIVHQVHLVQVEMAQRMRVWA